MQPSRPLFSLSGSVALVTGAAHGLGATIAEGLAEAGAAVALGDLDTPGAQHRASALASQGHRAMAVEMEVTSPASIADAVRRIQAELGPVDVLVNNAGLKSGAVRGSQDAAEIDPADWEHMLRVNLSGVLYCCQAVYPAMAERGGGSIVNMSSIYGVVAGRVRGVVSYSASKAGVIGLTRTLAVDWAPRGIRVNALAPTHMLPRDDEQRGAISEEQDATIRWRTPMARRGRQDEIVGPVIFLASDASSLVTGHTLAVDGGWLAW
jgi:2-deoxy-D-gluconate 3-dehydrogenase